jgi:hypothetical protein
MYTHFLVTVTQITCLYAYVTLDISATLSYLGSVQFEFRSDSCNVGNVSYSFP